MRANSFQNFQKQIGTFLFRNLNRIFGQGIAIFSHSVSAVNTCILVFYSKEQQGIRNGLYYLNENQLINPSGINFRMELVRNSLFSINFEFS